MSLYININLIIKGIYNPYYTYISYTYDAFVIDNMIVIIKDLDSRYLLYKSL